LKPVVIALDGNRVWLVDSDPVLHTVSESLETYLGVGSKIVAVKMVTNYVRNDLILRCRKC
jgi:hypothetical protein